MEITHLFGDIYSICGEYYIKNNNCPIHNIDFIHKNGVYYMDINSIITYITQTPVYGIYPGRDKLIIDFGINTITVNIINILIEYINPKNCVINYDDGIRLIINKN